MTPRARNTLPATAGHSPLGELGFQILVALGEGAAHGYAIGKQVEARTGGRLEPTTGTLYQALRRLLADGLIRPVTPSRAVDTDPRRKSFAITPAGKRAVAEEARRLEAMVQAARDSKLYPASS